MTTEEAVLMFLRDIPLIHRMAHGGPTDVIDADGGPVRAVAKLIADKDAEISEEFADLKTAVQGTTQDRIAVAIDRGAVEGVRDSINETGLIATSKEDGYARTSEGQRFSLLGPSGLTWDVYEHVGTDAVYRSSGYTKAFFDSLLAVGKAGPGKLYRWLDLARRQLMSLDTDGTLLAKLGIDVGVANGLTLTRLTDGRYRLSLGTGEGTIPIGTCRLSSKGRNSNVLAQQLDIADRILWRVLQNGRFEVASMRVTQGVLLIGNGRIKGGGNNTEVLVQFLDTSGRVLFRVMRDGTFQAKIASPAELLAARGTAATLGARLDLTLRPDGYPTSPTFGMETPREWRRKLFYLASRSAGDGFNPPNAYSVQQPAAAFFGDSWTDKNQHMWPLAKRLFGMYGRAGSGYAGVSSTESGNALPDASCIDPTIGWTRSGTWTSVNFTVPSPNIRAWRTSEVGATAILSGSSDREVRLCGLSNDAAIEYRYNDTGAWAPLSMAGSGATWHTLADPPAGAWTLKVRLVSGAWEHWGAALRNPGVAGLLLHKCGASSTWLAQWAAVDAAIFIQALTGLGSVDLIHDMWGTNDQYKYNAPTFIGHYGTVLGRQRTAWPTAGVIITSTPETLSPPEQVFTRVKDFDYASRPFAAANDAAHLSIQPFFGIKANYGQSGTQMFLDSDPVHPSDKGIPALLAPIFGAISRTT